MLLNILILVTLMGCPSRSWSASTTMRRKPVKAESSSVFTPTTTQLGVGYLDSLSTTEPMLFPASAPPPTPSSESSSTDDNMIQPGFAYVPILSLQQADDIANHIVAVCQRNVFNPITVFILDAAGCTIVSKRMDGCSVVGSPDFARAKAYSCIVNKYPSRNFRDRYTSTDGNNDLAAKFCQMTTMVAVSGNQMAPFPGGIVLKLRDHMIGAVGVSGAAGDEDEYCAIQGVKEANIDGLRTVPDIHSCATVKDAF